MNPQDGQTALHQAASGGHGETVAALILAGCDISLQDQNDASLAKGIQPSAPSEFKPVIKKSVTYIVAAVLLNSEGEVLMMQVGHHK